MKFPVKPGPVTLVYPEWIPGNHRPSGPIANLMGLHMFVDSRELSWQRDPIDSYAFHVEVPSGARELEVSFDTSTTDGSAGASGPAASSNVLDLNWNQVVLYPQGSKSDDVRVTASVNLPDGWQFGTAMPVEGSTRSGPNSVLMFKTVSLTTLVDSPLIAGDHYRKIDVTPPGEGISHVIDMVSESEEGLAMTQQDQNAYRKLVAETGALFGARHYTEYHFLLTLSDQAGHHGVEHHESSDNSTDERMLLEPDLHLVSSDLLPHEFTHSWNGKYRRPAGLATPNYQEPMIGDLLWVYEGLTDYLGQVLSARSGLKTPDQFREGLALTAASLDHEVGRNWRSIEDTTRSVQMLRMQGPEWSNLRRSLDYYPEGSMIWLEVDTIIRNQTGGKKSLNDFCRAFHGGQSGPPKVVPYTFDDVVRTLNTVAPYDWAGLLNERVNGKSAHAPLGGIEGGGWKLVYTDQPNVIGKVFEKLGKSTDVRYSLGFSVREDGTIPDVIPGSPAYEAGLGPRMKLIAINGRKFSRDVLLDAVRSSKGSSQNIDLLVENANFIKSYPVAYSDGLKYPHLVRADGPDVLTDIVTPLTK